MVQWRGRERGAVRSTAVVLLCCATACSRESPPSARANANIGAAESVPTEAPVLDSAAAARHVSAASAIVREHGKTAVVGEGYVMKETYDLAGENGCRALITHGSATTGLDNAVMRWVTSVPLDSLTSVIALRVYEGTEFQLRMPTSSGDSTLSTAFSRGSRRERLREALVRLSVDTRASADSVRQHLAAAITACGGRTQSDAVSRRALAAEKAAEARTDSELGHVSAELRAELEKGCLLLARPQLKRPESVRFVSPPDIMFIDTSAIVSGEFESKTTLGAYRVTFFCVAPKFGSHFVPDHVIIHEQ